nr:hypothetical protein [Tanacetum cinerariifolium]
MHNNIMAAGSRDRPPMLATGRYPQWRSRFLRYIDTRPNGEALRKCILSGPYKPTTVSVQAVKATDDSLAVSKYTTVETPMNMSPENKAHFLAEKEPEWSRFITIVKQQHQLDEVSYHKLFDILKQYQNEVNELRVERLARNANPLALVATAQADQDQYYQTSRYAEELALIAKYFKKIYKPTNNNLRTSSNSKNKNVDMTPLFKNDSQSGQFGNQRTVNVAAARENVGSKVVQQSRIKCFNCREFGHFAKECRKPKRVKDSTYHKEKMLLCKQAEQGVPLQAEQYDWLANTDEEVDEQELEAHYSYMAKIQEVPTPDSGTDSEPVEQNEQNDVESDDERVVLANLIANLKLDKANTTLAQEPKECKTILAKTSKSPGESISVRDSCLVALQTKQTEFEKYKAFNDRTIDYDKLKRKLNEALGQLAQKDTVIREGLKTKAYEILVVKQKHDELMKQSLLTKSHYEGLVKQKMKVITDLKLREEHDIEKMLSMEKQLKFLNEIVYKRSQSIQTIHMMAPNVPTYNGRPTFANPRYLKKAQSEIPCLYAFPYDQNTHANRLIPDGEETLALERDNALAELQCMYLHKVKECDCLAQKLSKQTESVSKKVHTELLQYFAKVEKQLISLDIALQKCKEHVKNDTVCNKKASNLFRKEREQCIKIQDLKAKLQDKNIAISELKKLIEKGKGKSVDTKFDRPYVVQQPNAQRIPKPSVLGKLAPFSNSLDRIYFPKTMSVSKGNVSEGLSKPVTAQTLPQTVKQAVSNTNVLKPGMYRIDNRTAHTKAPQLPQTVRNTNPRVSTSTGVNYKPNIVQLILFIVDSGCTKHMMGNLKLLCNFVEKFLGIVHFGNDQFAPILGYGGLVQGNVTINMVYYVKGLNRNLFSVGQFCNADLEVAFRKLSHLNFEYINLLSKKDIVIGLLKLKYVKDQLCLSFELSNAKRSSFKSKAVPSLKGRLNLLHMDLCGPMRVASINGKKYILVIVDDYSRYTWTLFLRSKDETPEVLKDFLTMIKRNLQALVITVRIDRGTEFLNKTLNAFFKEEGIEHQTSTTRTPEQNGVVERRNHTLVEAARTMLSALQLSLFFWAEAITTACYTQNRSIIIPIHGKTPYHIINDKKPLIKHLHIFGCIYYITRDGKNLDKMKEKGDQCILASDYDNPDPVPQRQDVSSSADEHVPSQQELDLLFGPLYDEFSMQNNNDQAEEGEQLQDDKFTNPFCAPTQDVAESSSHNIGNLNVPTFNQPQVSEYRWTKDQPLKQVRGNPSRPVQTKRQLATDPEMYMYALTVSTAKPKNIKEAMADSAWIPDAGRTSSV